MFESYILDALVWFLNNYYITKYEGGEDFGNLVAVIWKTIKEPKTDQIGGKQGNEMDEMNMAKVMCSFMK